MEFFTAGKLGEMFTSMAFASALVAMISFFMAERRHNLEKESWERMGVGSFGLHIFSILGIIATLFYLIYDHRYEYHYVWSHSSNELPVYYMISCFWEGQEGSFLLWCFWHSVLGGLLLFGKNEWRNPVIAIIASVEVILVSMLLGAYFFGLKVGSSPFLLLKEAFPDAEIYTTNPDFVPSNGNGLNPLLQNYWMVIHPPTLFLGFAATVVPFAYVMAGLIKGKYHEWIKPAMPWTTFSVMILGVGIIMGGYWAYETLNFGGYWAWDPVENSSLVPWICGVAALHTMLIYRKTKAYLKLTQMMIIGTFLLVLYSTFLTRSGILGETSVHTFTDLGLSGQLLLLVFVYIGFVAGMMAYRWKSIPMRDDESKVWSAEFMLFMGILIFCFSGLLITLATSIPVFNAIFGTDMAPPPNVPLFYYKWTIWFAILFGIFSGIGQFLWWKIAKNKSVADAIFRPFLIAVLTGSAVILAIWFARTGSGNWEFAYDKIFAAYKDPSVTGTGLLGKAMGYLKYGFFSIADELLLYSALFGLFANIDVLFALIRKNRKGLKIMGGTIVHIGFALMLLGMLFSSGYDSIISKNLRIADLTGAPMSEEEKRDNVLLPKFTETSILGYNVTYTGKKEAVAPVDDIQILEESQGYFKFRFDDASGERFFSVQPRNPFLKRNEQGELIHSTADTEEVKPTLDPLMQGQIDLTLLEETLNNNIKGFKAALINNRTQYGLEFKPLDEDNQPRVKNKFTLWPEAEINEEMQSIISHPSRKIFWDRDIYVYASSLPDPKSLEPKYYTLPMKVGEVAEIGDDIKLMLAQVRNVSNQPDMQKYDVAAAAYMVAYTERDTFGAQPVFLIDGKIPDMKPDAVPQLGLELAFVGIDPATNTMTIQAKYVDRFSDHVTIKAIQKPFINLLWLGTFILVFGFGLSIYRRWQESRRK
ncbi:MAG: cytochrome c biogenesis protein CcsA [Bacteroidota bacterium]